MQVNSSIIKDQMDSRVFWSASLHLKGHLVAEYIYILKTGLVVKLLRLSP